MPTTDAPKILSATVTSIVRDPIDVRTVDNPRAMPIPGLISIHGVATLEDGSRTILQIYLTDEERADLVALLARIEARFRAGV